MTASDGQREQLAAALSGHGSDWRYRTAFKRAPHLAAADALLADGGVVQRIANQRAAQALREAAAQIADIDPKAALWLTTRADTLSGPS